MKDGRFSEIHTKRLFLREITEEDARTIVSLRNDPRIYRFFCSPHAITLEEHLQWYKNQYLKDLNRYDWLAFAENYPIGVFALTRMPHPSKAEVNYWLCPDSWGNGYAQEAVEALLDQTRDVWGVSVVYAVIHCENIASLRFAERMGFQKSDTKDYFYIYEKTLFSL